ncbi:MAG: hypothetical protein IJB29_03775 [Mailhella sp.]|nr:hypothetical protein [Mailhella sp.]
MSKPLFTAPDAFAVRGLAYLFRALDEVMPMNAAQRRDLSMACRDLSAMLTTDRDSLDRPYWTAPRLTSAYLRYFLPWNLVRLSSLLPGLDFGRIPDEPLILDMGSGPLTLPLALWLSRPDLREKPVTIVASDTTPHILELGRRIFDILRAELAPDCRWTIRTMRASVTQALHRIHAKPGMLWMMTTGNVLNEMEERRARPGHQMSDRMRSLLEDASRMLMDGGLIFSVEPGTRQGGRLLTNLRKSALGGVEEEPEFEDLTTFALREEQAGRLSSREFDDDWDEDDDMFEFGQSPLFKPLSPCPHVNSCPMLDRRSTAWCHVNAPAEHAPQALRDLSARAGLDKDSISLSFLLLKKLTESEAEAIADAPKRSRRPQSRRKLSARIVSDAFVVPDYPGRARYACTELGLALIPDSAHLSPGALCEGWTTPGLDRKSQAFIMMLDDADQRRPARPGSFDARSQQNGDGRSQRTPRPAPFSKERGSREERRPFRHTSDDRPAQRRDRGDSPRREERQGERHTPRSQRSDSRPQSRRPKEEGSGRQGGTQRRKRDS